MEPEQLSLFPDTATRTVPSTRQSKMLMDKDALLRWKSEIFNHQQRARESFTPQQGMLFEIAPSHVEPDAIAQRSPPCGIDPFSLLLQPMSFYQMPVDSPGEAALYFVIDTTMPLILYIGETCRSNLRWKGFHDCKRYLDNYQSLHRQHGLKTAVNIAFCWEAPLQTRARQQLERSLIFKWLSPFNKENVQRFAKPFGCGSVG